MNIRKAVDYSVGLEIGREATGWAAVDGDGELLKFKGERTWGVRLYDPAQTAEEARLFRSSRRRRDRRKWRLGLLQELMAPDVLAADPDFYERMAQSSLAAGDGDFEPWEGLFPDAEGRAAAAGYPTVYHLRRRLVESGEREDARLVYLALHHILKNRGHFLIEGAVSSKDLDAGAAVSALAEALAALCEARGIGAPAVDADGLSAALEGVEGRKERRAAFQAALGLPAGSKAEAKAVADAVFGLKARFSSLFPVDAAAFALSDEEKADALAASLDGEDAALLSAIRSCFASRLLAGIMSDAGGGTLSSAMVARYEAHREDLAMLKRIVRRDHPGEYDAMFRGELARRGRYAKGSARGYTGYVLGSVARDDLYAAVRRLIGDDGLEGEEARWRDGALERMETGSFLPKLRTRENASIPNQLHLEELEAIVANQSRHYPSLAENASRIAMLATFRVPYYVGPLGSVASPERDKPFAWAVRRPGMEGRAVRPWNFDEVIDRDASAEAFIDNLVGECTYLLGEKVLPRNSLLYSEFCVRQELNVIRWGDDGEGYERLDGETAQAVYDDVFLRRKAVTASHVEEYLSARFGRPCRVKGVPGEGRFGSSLRPFIDFRAILGRDVESASDYAMVEDLIAWSTVFEDGSILRRRVEAAYGPAEAGGDGSLTAGQVEEVLALRYRGWGKLSRRFLEGLRAGEAGRGASVMSALRDPGASRARCLAEVLSDPGLGFERLLEEANAGYLAGRAGSPADAVPGSPAIRRGVNQALLIVQEIARVAGRGPARIYVEVPGDLPSRGRGPSPRTRAQALRRMHSALPEPDRSALLAELDHEEQRLVDDRVYLYFLQGGRCAYTGARLDLGSLSSSAREVHILPPSIARDDTLDNRVLVSAPAAEAPRGATRCPRRCGRPRAGAGRR